MILNIALSFSTFLLSSSISLSLFSVLVESVENQDPGTNADLTSSVDSAEPVFAQREHTVNASHPSQDQEVVNTCGT